MPEGHTIHRYARLHRAALADRRLAASSPQGRFAAGAARIDGRRLHDVEAYGKHLFYRWQMAEPATLHVHLGLFGHFRSFHSSPAPDGQAAPVPPPTAGTRLELRAEDGTILRLAGPTACHLILPEQEESLLARLGPDPLRADADPARFSAALRRRSVGIGQALLDQRVIAGIGNAFRAEVLFLTGIHPNRPARDLTAAQVEALWTVLVRLLRTGERTGRIATVEADEQSAGERRANDRPADDRRVGERSGARHLVYVYRRGGEACRRCGTPIRSWKLGGRTISACPSCQPR